MLNRVALVGRLTRDPDVRSISSGQVTQFTVAVDRNFKNRSGERDTDFIPVVTFNRLAEICGQYLAKGRLVSVSGRIQTRSYDAQDGTKRYVTEVIADEVEFLSTGTRAEGSAAQQARPSAAPRPSQPAQAPAYSESYGVPMEGFEEIDDLDVPF
jgi:single-strand DNA-binding protein